METKMTIKPLTDKQRKEMNFLLEKIKNGENIFYPYYPDGCKTIHIVDWIQVREKHNTSTERVKICEKLVVRRAEKHDGKVYVILSDWQDKIYYLFLDESDDDYAYFSHIDSAPNNYAVIGEERIGCHITKISACNGYVEHENKMKALSEEAEKKNVCVSPVSYYDEACRDKYGWRHINGPFTEIHNAEHETE